ncbi:MAG: PqqD family protein [Bacteroidales bacterium]|nr:PqqD family protein [Bacteroidales bacterium]
MNTTMKVKKNIAISENGFVFNPATGESFSANPIGLEILNQLRQGETSEAIIQSISNAYHAEPSAIERDLNDFIESMRQYHLFDHEDE